MRKHLPTPVFFALIALASLAQPGCSSPDPGPPPDVVVTIAPLKAIIAPLLPPETTIHVLAPAGASPQTFSLKSSDARKAAGAKLVVYAAADLDGWAAKLDAQQKLELLPAVPEHFQLHTDGAAGGDGHDHGPIDPHWWLDPIAVLAVQPAIMDALEVAGIPVDQAKYDAFADELRQLHLALTAELEPVKGKAVALAHPSMGYFFNRFGLATAGIIEPSPGKEPSPKYLQELAARMEEADAFAVATEPQMPEGPAKSLAENTGLPLITLDPLGGGEGRDTYSALLEFNAAALAGAGG